MGDPHEHLSQSSEIKHVLPDVVHSQQIPSVGAAVAAPTETLQIDTPRNTGPENDVSRDVENISITESISEHIPSKIEYSLTDSDNAFQLHESRDPPKEEVGERPTKHSSLNVPCTQSPLSDNATHQQSQESSSWPLEGHASPDVHPLSEESPVILASSELSKEGTDDKSLQESSHPSQHASLHDSQEGDATPKQSPREDEYLDSLDEENSRISNVSIGEDSLKSSRSEKVDTDKSSGSEEIIKLDIRGKGVPKFPLSTAKIIFGPPPEGSTVIGPNIEPLPMFQNLLSPFLVGAGDSVQVEDIYDNVEMPYKDPSLERSPEQSPEKDPSPRQSGEDSMVDSFSSDKIQQDVLIEEVTVDYETREPNDEIPERLEDASIPTQPKSFAPDETISFSTLTTDYKTICEEYHVKLVHLEDAITQRDELIEELTVSLQRSVKEQDQLRTENVHLTNEVQNLQHLVAEQSLSEHNTVQAQLSDFMKYESLVKDDSTKFYSALMSGGSSMQSSNGEKDNENEEITIHYSRSDLKSSSSDNFQTGFETKLTTVINKFDEFIEENLRNKLRESIIQVLCEEIGKMRIESDTELRDVETQLQQDKQAYTVETRRLRELLASVKAGNADIDALRQELSIKHEKEMENLRTYFEKKCSDMERSYSEEVWRGRACASPTGSLSSEEGAGGGGGAGDCSRRRTRSAEFPSLTYEPSQFEQALKQASKKYEQQIEELKTEHAAFINELQGSHAAAIASLELQITQLKAHIQTTENTEPNVSLYQQDIDLELEKGSFEKRLEEVRQEVAQELQNQIQVLLSDPDAEVSSWPVELVALREKFHDTRAAHDKEISGVREESLGGEADKWRARRNVSFDQNRQLEEVTKERDGLKRVAVTLQRVVSQLVAYCACAEDELNRTVLAQLLSRLHTKDESSIQIDDYSRPSTPNLDLSSSLVSKGKHVHFAPDLHDILTDLDEEGLAAFLAKQGDVSADIKRELEVSLKRLRNEAHDLLELSSKLAANKRPETKMLESGDQVQITELVEQLDGRRRDCDHCELHRKTMEEAMAECLQRESLLRGDLEAAMIKIAQLMTSGGGHEEDLVAEGYGCGPQQPLSLPPRGARPRPDGSQSLDGSGSPRGDLRALQQYADALQRERDDLQQQLEAANRQLRSTRQFVEEQAGEREAERDEFARRLAELRGENGRLGARLAASARILNEMHCFRLARCNCRAHDAHVEQLEAQTRDMNQIIAELETRKAATDDELKSQEEKISLLREVIQNLENQLEQKTSHETEILEELDQMKNAIDDRDKKMRSLVGELEALRNQSLGQSEAVCVKCGEEDDRYEQLLERVREQGRLLEDKIHRSSARLERTHEVASASCSEPSEDVSVPLRVVQSPSDLSPRAGAGAEPLPELCGVWECLEAHARVEEAAVKRIADLDMQRAQLKQVAQEVRAERDVLQARMSEQALKISSLSARLQQQRNDAEALAQHAASQLTVQLHDTTAEVQRLKEELESKEKQLARMKLTAVDEKAPAEERASLYGNSCNPKDKVIILERELSQAQTRIAQLENLARSLETDKGELQAALRSHQRALAEKEDQLQEILALNLNDINKDEKSEVEGKVSARTLSDIVSISEFDEQDLQMRKAELKGQNMNLSGAPYDTNKSLNKTLPPEMQKPNMSSLNLEYADRSDFTSYSPRADSLPAHLTSTQNKDFLKTFKRNINETTVFGTIDKVEESIKAKENIPDNCSLYPNRDISDSKDVSVEPKKINFSLEASKDNKTQNAEEFTSLRELGITLDIKQENFPDILTQLKHEIKKSRSELEKCKSELKHAEEQLCEFPALKEEVEELKSILENTMSTMENDKKFYENQLENFSSNKKLLEQRLSELTQEINDKSKDLHLLKEDILRRENMILELAKEKRNLTNKMAELEVKIDELQSRNNLLEKYESENHQMREKVSELQKLEQLVTEKNQQIDSLNQHLDRHDDLQRCLNDKTEEFENLKEAYEEKSSELDHLQDTIDALNRDNAKLNQDNNDLINTNKDLKLKLTKVEKEQENASVRLQSSETEIERINSLNNELTSKLEELKQLTDKLKDKETEIEILHEDINSYHEEIATFKEQLKMVSRSPSPRKSGEDKRPQDRHASNDKKQLVKIRKQISLLQHELDFNKKELNDKAFELAKAKLDVTELKSSVSQAQKQASDKELVNSGLVQQVEELQREKQALAAEKQALRTQLEMVVGRIREESSLGELKAKLQEQTERCFELEQEVHDLKGLVERLRDSTPVPGEQQKALVVSGTRSPTAELERALRDQLDYSHTLDEDILEQILSASSDEREDIPRLALNTSKSSSSIHSSSSERLQRARAESERLQAQVNNLELRLRDKDALITELNRVRDKLLQDWQTSKLQLETERDNSGRLQLLLDTQKETAESLQHQDSSMIQILKKRLESTMQSELELQQKEQQLRARVGQLERDLLGQGGGQGRRQHEIEANERLKGEIVLLKSRLEAERARYADLQALLDHTKLQLQRDLDTKTEACMALRGELVDLKRLKHDAGVELLRAKELLNIQASTIQQLESKLNAVTQSHRPAADTLTEIESHKLSLAHDIASLKKCLVDSSAAELAALRAERAQLLGRVQALEGARGAALAGAGAEEKEQAIRYLHGRCLRLESSRKALVWQKRYLQRVLAGYEELERNLRLPTRGAPSTGVRRFKCVAVAVIAVLRMEFLVRRRQHVRALSAAAILRPREPMSTTHTPSQYAPCVSPPSRDRSGVPPPATRPDGLARRLLRQDLRLDLPASPMGDYVRRSPYTPHSPREDVLSTPRGEVATAYLNKLDLVSRCLHRAMDATRDTP